MSYRLLVISYYAHVDGYAMATPVLTRMRHLAERGVQLHLIHSGIGNRQCPYVATQSVVAPWTPLGLRNALRRWRRSGRAPKALRRLSHLLDPGLYLVSRIEKALFHSTWAWQAVRVGERIAQEQPFDAVYSIGGVSDGLIAGQHLAARTGLPWIVELLDPLLTTSVADSAHSALTRGKYARIESAILHDSDRLIVLTDGLRGLLQPLHAHPEHVIAIPLGYEQELTGPPPSVDSDQLVFGHFGGLYRERTGTAFLTALKGFLADNATAAGGIRVRQLGYVEPRVAALHSSLGLGDALSVEGNIPHAQALEQMARTPVLLLVQHDSELSRVTVPLKFWEYLGARRPIFALVDNAQIQGILSRLGGWCVAPGDAACARAALEDCYRRFRAGELREGWANAEIAPYSAESSADTFLALVRDLTSQRRRSQGGET